MNEKKRKSILVSLAVCSILLIVVGVTYAYWTLTRKQSDTNVVNASCLDISYTDESNGISLASTWPQEDEDGLELEGYTFTVTNNCDNEVAYNVELEDVTTGANKLNNKYIRVALDDRVDTLKYYEDGTNGKVLKTFSLAAGEDATHELKMWIDEYTPIGQNNKTFAGKVNVIAGQGIKAPSIIDSEEIDGGLISYTWYDNGDLDIITNGDYSVFYLLDYLINHYVQINDSFTSEEKNYLNNYYGTNGNVPSELYLALTSKKDVVLFKVNYVGIVFEKSSGLSSAITNSTNQNYQQNIVNAITDSTLKTIYTKLLNMPKFNVVRDEEQTDVSIMYELANFDVQRLIQYYTSTEMSHYVDINEAQNISFESIDIRTKGSFEYFGYNNLIDVYAPNADIVLPPETTVADNIDFLNYYCNSFEFLGGSANSDFHAAPSNCSKVIYPETATHIYPPMDMGNDPLTKSGVDVYIRGSQKIITNFTPSQWKSVTWNYYD